MYAPTMAPQDPPPGCTCGPFWSVVPPPPCPFHSAARWVLVPAWWPIPAYPAYPDATRWTPSPNLHTYTVSTGTTTTTLPLSTDNPYR